MDGKMPSSIASMHAAAVLRRLTQSIDSAIGSRLRQRRLELGLDPTLLSLVTGILPLRSMAIEAGEIRPTASELYDLARALGLRISDLFRDVAVPSG